MLATTVKAYLPGHRQGLSRAAREPRNHLLPRQAYSQGVWGTSGQVISATNTLGSPGKPLLASVSPACTYLISLAQDPTVRSHLPGA